MMNRPTAAEIANGKPMNRYEVVTAVAKGARLATDEYLEIREDAERLISNHETDKPLMKLIGEEYETKKPITIAIERLLDEEYVIARDGVDLHSEN